MSTAGQPATTGLADEPQEAIHILVVDDEPDVQEMLALRLRRQTRAGKYKFQYALDGVMGGDKVGHVGGLTN